MDSFKPLSHSVNVSKKEYELLNLTEDLAGIGSFQFNAKTGDLFLSDGVFKLYDLDPRDSMEVDLVRSYIHPEDLKAFDLYMIALTKGEASEAFTYRFVSNGKIKYFQAQTYHSPTAEDSIYIGLIKEITKEMLHRNRAEAKVLEQLQVNKSLSDALEGLVMAEELSKSGSFRYDPEIPVLQLSRGAQLIYGVDSAELPIVDLRKMLHAEDIEVIPDLSNLKQRALEDRHLNYRIWVNGQIKYIEAKTHYLDQGQGLGEVMGIIRDKTAVEESALERERILDALQESNSKLTMHLELLQTAEEVAKAGSYTYNVDTGEVILSKGARSIYGLEEERSYTMEEIAKIFHKEDLAKIAPPETLTEEFEAAPAQFRVVVNGEIKHLEAKGFLMKEKSSQNRIQLGIISDRTAIVNAEDKNQQLIESLRKSNLELEQFAYVASHDLQEPLRKIQIFGERLESKAKNLGEKERDYLKRMQKAAERMQRLIQDLLALSRVGSGSMDSDNLDLTELLHKLLSDLQEKISEEQAEVSLPNGLPEVYGNADQLYRLFQNLVSNALKFSKPEENPKVEFKYKRISRSKAKKMGFLNALYAKYDRITVKDHGIGFDEQYLEKIFTVFQRLHGRSEYEGTGVGLAIVQKIAVNHGGFITASSAPNEGAVFHLLLPVHNSKKKKAT